MDMHYGASRILCGARVEMLGLDKCRGGSEGPCPEFYECECGCDCGESVCLCENVTETIADVTCARCLEGVHAA